MTEAYILNIEQLNQKDMFDSYFKQVSYYRQNKIENTKNNKDKLRSLGVGILTDKYLQTKGLREKDMVYGTGVNGKPYFECFACCPDYKEIFFNASHSGKYVVCAFSDNPVGCDVETVDKKNLRVAKRYFSDEEKRYIFECQKGSSCFQEKEKSPIYEDLVTTERFVRVWTIKEAYLKWLGTGLTKALDSFEISGLFENDITVWDNILIEETEEKKEIEEKKETETKKTKKKADCKISEIVLDNARIAICSSDKNVSYSMFFEKTNYQICSKILREYI